MAVILTSPNLNPIKDTDKTKDGTVYRILTVFEKTIELDELSLISNNEEGKNRKAEDVMSTEIPLIKINDYIFAASEIVSFKIDSTQFLPKITLTVMLKNQVFLAKEIPKDGDIISVAIRSRNDLLRMIRNDYVITGMHVLPNLTDLKSPVSITFYGELFVPGLKSQKGDFSFIGTSFEALIDVAKKYGLGFASNEDNTNDKQIWLKANMAGDIYINSIVDRAWKDSNSFYDCWIDVYYNLNFINVNKQLLSMETDIDLGVLISNLDKNWIHGAANEEEKATLGAKLFSNYTHYRTTSFFISNWRPLNRSSEITFQYGTKMTCEMFEHNKYIYENPKTEENKNYWTIPIDPIYDKNKEKTGILLRGRATFDASTNTTDLKRANYSFVNLYEKFPWLGVQYTIGDSELDNKQWSGNHHKHYQRAKVHNLINLKELDKINVHIQVDGNNFNVIKGDKVPVLLIKRDSIENMKINKDAGLDDMMDLFYSGWYYVKGFVLIWTNKDLKSIVNGFSHEFILSRREWPAPVPISVVK